MPDFPTDAKVLLTISMGSVELKAYMAFVIDTVVTGENTFTAQSGAYANAQTKVALYIFEKGKCEYGKIAGEEVHDIAECKSVVSAAGVSESQQESCTAPADTDSATYKCLLSKYLIVQILQKPTFKSGLNGPTLKAKTTDAVSITLSVYTIAKVSAYKGMFSLYVVPELKATINAKPSSSTETTKCDGVEISAPVLQLNQVYAWVDFKISAKMIYESCSWDFCNKAIAMGMRAPKLLSTAINIPLPSFITSLFPICASLDKVTPSTGKLTAEKDSPSSLALGSFLTLTNGELKLAASATISAAQNVFPENTQVIASTGKSTSPKAKGGSFIVSALNGSGEAVSSTSADFAFEVDFSGESTLTADASTNQVRPVVKSVESHSLLPKMTVRGEMQLMFCAKIANCTDADWTPVTGSKITGATVQHNTKNFGTYVLHGSDGYKTVSGTPNSSPSSGSAPFAVFSALCLAVTALAHFCI